MPIYEYNCQACGHHFEELVFSWQDQVKCPKCGEAKQVDRQMSVFASCGAGEGGNAPAPSSGGQACGSKGFS